MGLETGIWGGETEEEEEKEKIPHMCESIGHRPLRTPAQKGDGITEGQMERKSVTGMGEI